jgi:hypothetical protein
MTDIHTNGGALKREPGRNRQIQGENTNMEKVVTGLLVLAGIIHLLPVSGVLGVERLAAVYGVSPGEPNLEILMRHRAVLFGLLGLFLVYAAFQPSLQRLAIIAGLVSVVSFFAIAWSVGGYNDSVRKVIIADIIALVALVAAGIIHVVSHMGGGRNGNFTL